MSIETVWALQVDPRREYPIDLIPVDGDMPSVNVEDATVDIGRRPITSGYAMRSGRRVATEHLATKLRRSQDPAGATERLVDIESSHFGHVVTERFKTVVDALCGPGTHQFEPVEVMRAKSGEDAMRYWFVPGIRLRALDPDRVDPPLNHHGYYPLLEGIKHATAAFQADEIAGNHIFATAEWRGIVFVSDAFRRACDEAGITGLAFEHRFDVA